MEKLVKFFIVWLITVINMSNSTAQIIRENVAINVNANVLSTLSVTNDQDVSFGNISGTTTGEVFLDPKGSESSYVGATATAGKIIIAGDNNQSIRIGWPSTITLDDGGENDMTLTIAVSGSGSDNQATSSDLTAENGFTTVNLVLSNFYIWIGGSLGVLENQPAGTYTGTADITVEYN